MRRALGLVVIALMAMPVQPASAERRRDPRPTVEIVSVTGPQEGPEGESEYIFHIDAHDPNGVITEVIVEFGDNSTVFAHTYTRVLLFLASSDDTVHEQLDPPHFQVLHGGVGSYEISDGNLVGAPFTLDEVRDAAGT